MLIPWVGGGLRSYSRCLSSPERPLPWERFTSRAQRCYPSNPSMDSTVTMGVFSVCEQKQMENVLIGSVGPRWSWALICPERRDPDSHQDRGRLCFSAHTPMPVVNHTKFWNKFPLSPQPCPQLPLAFSLSVLLPLILHSLLPHLWQQRCRTLADYRLMLHDLKIDFRKLLKEFRKPKSFNDKKVFAGSKWICFLRRNL